MTNTYELLTPEEQGLALKLAGELNLKDYNTVLQFGKRTQLAISQFSDRLLFQMKKSDVSRIGGTLQNLITTIRAVDPSDFDEEETGFLRKLFKRKSLSPQLIMNYEHINVQIDRIDIQLQHAKKQLLEDIDTLEQLFTVNQSYYHDLNTHIAAGEMKMLDFERNVLPAFEQEARENPTGFAPQHYEDAKAQLESLEKRLYDLQIARELTIQAAPQIRMIQQANQQLAEKIQMSIMTTVPLWKSQMSMLINLQREKQHKRLQQRMAQANEAMQSHTNAIPSVKALKSTQNELLQQVEETLQLQHETTVQKQEVEQHMRSLVK